VREIALDDDAGADVARQRVVRRRVDRNAKLRRKDLDVGRQGGRARPAHAHIVERLERRARERNLARAAAVGAHAALPCGVAAAARRAQQAQHIDVEAKRGVRGRTGATDASARRPRTSVRERAAGKRRRERVVVDKRRGDAKRRHALGRDVPRRDGDAVRCRRRSSRTRTRTESQ
jgi:hypothetical protein